MSLLQPRRCVLAAVVAAFAVAAWLLLVPVTAVYVTSADNPTPHDVTSRYTWWTTEENFVYSDAGTSQHTHPVNGIRLNCANVFSIGPHEQAQTPAGPQACATVHTPRCIVALSLFVLALLGLLAIPMLPATTRRSQNRYRQPYSQRRALK
jgi:hypothetical protein